VIFDLAAEPSIESIETDIAIIGSGPAGISLASGLNRECCVIESGGRDLDIEDHWRFQSVNAGDRTRVDSLRVRGVGGASLRWTGRCIPLDPYDFEDRPWISETAWPIGFDELTPWFERAGALMELQPSDIARSFPAKELEDAMARDARWQPSIWRFADHGQRGIFRFGAHMASSFEGERRTLFYHAHCAQVMADEKRVKALLLVTRNGRHVLVRARHFVIAAGCVEASRLLLDTHRGNRALLGQVEGWLGRGFNQHLRVDAGSLSLKRETLRAWQRQLGIFRRKGTAMAERGFAIHPDFARREQIGNASLILRFAPKAPRQLRDAIARVKGGLLDQSAVFAAPAVQVEIDTEQSIMRESRIELDEQRDPLGRPRARVHWKISEVDCRTVYMAATAFGDFVQSRGFGTLDLAAGLVPDAVPDAIRRDSNHQLGGTRMSETPQTGVVDRDLTVHGVENLSVVGGSVFSTGGHANPTQTIVALALRLAEHLNAKA
jgi:choline dehydrogenase-like flavoprotein